MGKPGRMTVEDLFGDTAIPLQVMLFHKAPQRVPAFSHRGTLRACNKFKPLQTAVIAFHACKPEILARNLLLTHIAHGWVGLEPYRSDT